MKRKSLRERLEAHRASAVCASCHKIMDPLGLALENFDLVGAWREFDGGRLGRVRRAVDGTRLSVRRVCERRFSNGPTRL